MRSIRSILKNDNLVMYLIVALTVFLFAAGIFKYRRPNS